MIIAESDKPIHTKNVLSISLVGHFILSFFPSLGHSTALPGTPPIDTANATSIVTGHRPITLARRRPLPYDDTPRLASSSPPFRAAFPLAPNNSERLDNGEKAR